jgi:hypothetical protein
MKSIEELEDLCTENFSDDESSGSESDDDDDLDFEFIDFVDVIIVL